MNLDFGHFLAQASWIVKFVMLILVMASIFSWTLIVQRHLLFRRLQVDVNQFERQFDSGLPLKDLYHQIHAQKTEPSGITRVFQAGFNEFLKLREGTIHSPILVDNITRAMRIAASKENNFFERHLTWLATIASTSPYVGLLGTVWGILNAFQMLGGVQQATLPMVAPGISEALITTAMGLFAAIPATIAYNRFINELELFQRRCDNFQEAFINRLQRQIYLQTLANPANTSNAPNPMNTASDHYPHNPTTTKAAQAAGAAPGSPMTHHTHGNAGHQAQAAHQTNPMSHAAPSGLHDPRGSHENKHANANKHNTPMSHSSALQQPSFDASDDDSELYTGPTS